MTPLFLLRHGPTGMSARGVPVGRSDLPVTPEADVLWTQVRADLLAMGIQRVLTSDLRRARLHALDLGIPALVLPDLGEQSFGEWEGLPWGEIKGAEPFLHNPVHGVPPGGESFARCASRTLLAFQGALEGEMPTLVLAHGGPLRAILAHFLGMGLDRALDIAWQPFGLTRLDLYGTNRGLLHYHNRPLPWARTTA